MYRIDPETGFTQDPETTDATQPEQPREPLLCSTCLTRITWKDASTIVNGAHKHVFVNPSGLVFEVGCFYKTVNLSGLGPVTSEFTWFPGYSWQTVLCSTCDSQMGWIYHAGDGSVFFGLILDRLVESK